jgi:NTE family protein
MSVPGAFAPTKVDDRLLADGGIKRNLPVEVARAMGAEVIIAVNVGTPLLAREDLSSAIGVAQQMISILTEQNVEASLAALTANDILVAPDLRGFSFLDFGRGAEMVARGQAATLALGERLSHLALDERSYREWEARRVRATSASPRAVDSVVTEGARRTNPRALEREVKDRAGVAPGRPVSDADLLAASRLLYGSGEFERVDVKIATRNGSEVVVLDVDEKPWGPDYIRIGGYALSDLRTDGRFSLTLQHTRTWINAWGAEWRNEFQFGDTRRFATSVYQPLGAGSPWYIEPMLTTVKVDFDIFGVGNQRTDRVTAERTDVSLTLGRRLGTTGVVRIGAGHEWFRSEPAISSRLSGVAKASGFFTGFGTTFDTLDDANFPRNGYLFDVSGRYAAYDDGISPRLRTYLLQLLHARTYRRTTLLTSILAGRSRDDSGNFGLGGFLNLSGTLTGAVSGAQAALLSLVAYHRMGELPAVVGRSWYAGVSLEAGNAWHHGEAGFGDLKKAGSLLLGLDTVAGPLYIAWGHTLHGGSSVYLLLGGPSRRN